MCAGQNFFDYKSGRIVNRIYKKKVSMPKIVYDAHNQSKKHVCVSRIKVW